MKKHMACGIGARVREMREMNNMTMEVLAEKVDLSIAYIGLIERGERTPSLGKLVEICNILHTSLDYIVNGLDDKVKSAISQDAFAEKREETADKEIDWPKTLAKANFIRNVQNTVLPHILDNEDYTMLLETIKHFVKQTLRVKTKTGKKLVQHTTQKFIPSGTR